MLVNIVGPFRVNRPFGTEIAFSKGLQAIGVDVHECDPNLPGQNLSGDADYTVVFKTAMSYNRYLLNMKGPVVVYQPDDLHYSHIQEMMKQMRDYAEHALVFQRSGVFECLQMGYKTARTLMLTADPYLYRPLRREKVFDVAFVGSLGDPVAHASRRLMLQTLQQNGVDVKAFSTNDVHMVNEIYNSSKVVLNHAADIGQKFGYGRGYQCRHFEAGFSRSCLLSNFLTNEEDDRVSGFALFDSQEDLVETVRELLSDERERFLHQESLYEDCMQRHHPVVRAAQLMEILVTL
jgi:hypothetical protein